MVIWVFAANCAVLDVNAACSGFIHALATARGLMLGGAGKVCGCGGGGDF